MQASTEMFWREMAELGPAKVASQLTDAESFRIAGTFGANNYGPLPVNVVRGEGCRVWDGQGREYIDCVGSYSAMAHGHLNAAVAEAIRAQMAKLTLTGRAVYTSELSLFAKGLALYTGLDKVCPMNTGAEAVETCIKIARKWAYTVKGVPPEQAEIVVCDGNFHGRTTTIVGFSTVDAYRDGFGPFTPGFKVVPFGDLSALEAAMNDRTAAFLAEPIQAEAGVLVPPEGYLRAVRELCDRRRVLLVWDEVQTGFCRTGRRFAWEHEGSRPDLMAVGKALGGGMVPVSAAVGSAETIGVLKPGDHGSTFGGNPLACAAALAAMAEMENGRYDELSAEMGRRLADGFRSLNLPEVQEIRGKGLLIGLEFDESVDSARLSEAFLAAGVLTKETRHRTFRFAPPLVIEPQIVDEIVDRVGRAAASARA